MVQDLEERGLVEAEGTERAGHRPERTVYRLTEDGREELAERLRELISEPVKEYPVFAAALSLIASLHPDELAGLLAERLLADLRRPIDIAGVELGVTGSIGIAVVSDQLDGESLLRDAGLKRLDVEASAAPGEEAKTHSSVGFGAVFAEVRVDPDLCTIRVKRLVGAYDAGRIVNPRLARSQCIGGMVGGIGMALLEEAEWDANLGRVANATIAEYLLPVSADVQDLDATFVESEDTILNPLGVKGLAELGLCGVAPAIANAVWHATGKRLRQLPITPDRLLMA